MLTRNIFFKNFSFAKLNKKIFTNLKKILSENNQILNSLKISYVDSFDSKKLEQYFNDLIETLNQDALTELAQKLDANDNLAVSMIEPNNDLTSTLPSIVQAVTTLSGGFRKRLTVRDHPNFSDKTLKNKIGEWIETLDQRGLLKDFLTIRNLPKTLEQGGAQTITDICICVALAAAELEKVMENKKEVDFPGIAMSAQSSLADSERPTDLALQLGYRFQHLLIDEFQDTSRSQIRFFKTLMESWNQEDGQTFFAVGDPMQSIYSFRDADVSVFLEIQKEGLNQLPVKSLNLSSNFRSDPKIVDWINKLFSDSVDQKNQQL